MDIGQAGAASPTESASSIPNHHHHHQPQEALAQQPEHQAPVSSLSKHHPAELHRSQSAPAVGQPSSVHSSAMARAVLQPTAPGAGGNQDGTVSPKRAIANTMRLRQDGIRASSDESYSLPDSSEILQHLAENCRDISKVQVLTNSARSHNIEHAPAKTASQGVDFALAVLGDAKKDVHRIRHGLPVDAIHSPASNLQQKMQSLQEYASKDDSAASTGQLTGMAFTHFPVLEGSSFGSMEEESVPGVTRCPSYASALTMNTCRRDGSATEKDPADNDNETEFTVILTPSSRGSRSPAKDNTEKHHFAQPTQSFSRRTGKTLRKQHAAQAQKLTPESPQKKSIRAQEPQLATSGRATQRQQKRMSLPDSWADVDSKECPKTPVSGSSSPSKGDLMMPPSLKKKRSTYMSPTKSTSQRAVAPSSQENHTKNGLRIDTSVTGAIPFPAFGATSPNKSGFGKGSLKSPTKIPRPTAGTHFVVQPVLPKLPMVKNTTTRRRTSHADILQPILNRLDNQGLRKDHPTETSIPGVPVAEKPTKKAYHPRKWSDARSVTSGSRSSRQNSVASTLLSPVIITQRQGLTQPPNDAVILPNRLIRTATSDPISLSASVQKKESGSLRATAQEFKPIWKPETAAQELGMLSWQGDLDCRSKEDWFAMPDDVRQSISTLREFKRSRLGSPLSGSTAWSGSSHKKAERSLYAKLDHVPATTHAPTVQAGQKLRPSLTPGRKNVRWMLEDTDGQERIVHFGRAPAPPAAASFGSEEMSPRSYESSPPKTPDSNNQAWTIGPALGRGTFYGWKGGDGKEISFAGYGAQAESNPNSPVRMQMHGMTADFDDDKENAMGEVPKVWPRSRRQWAEMAGYSKIPCGNIEYVGAVEQIPGSYPGFGICADCTIDGVH